MNDDYKARDARARVRVLATLGITGVLLAAGFAWLHARHAKTGDGSDGAAPMGPVIELAIRNPDGKPVAGALVRAVAGNSCRSETKSDTAGRVHLKSCPEAVPLELRVDAAGLARTLTRIDPPKAPGKPIAISMAWAALLRGSVRDDRGQPVARASITARRPQTGSSGADEAWLAITDDTGSFALDTLPAGAVAIEVSAELHETTVVPEVLAPTAEPYAIVLPRTAALAGRVLGADRKPVSGAEVTLAGSGVWPPRKVVTGDDGTFRYEPVPEGVYEVRASHGSDVSEPVEGLSIDAGALQRAELRLHPGAVLRGHVIDVQTGRPIAGVRVQVNEDALSASARSLESDASGSFAVGALRAVQHRVSARAQDYVVVETTALPGDKPVDLQMLRAATFLGTVSDEDDNPVAGAELEVIGTSEIGQAVRMSAALALPLANGNTPGSLVMPAAGDNLGVTAGRVPMIPLAGPLPTAAAANDPSTAFRSDEHGAFRLEGLPPGTLRIVARKPGFAAGESAERTLHPGELQGGVKLTLSRGGTVIGQVVDTHDAPIARVHVELLVESEGLARSTVSDEHGGFKFAAVRGRLTVTAYPPGLPPVRASAEVHAIEEQHVVLKIDAETVTLEGRVLDGRSRPIESATISLRALAASTPFAITVLTGADGRFEIPGLPAPPYRISADHAEYAPSKPITVKAVAASAPVEIQLASGSSLHGAVIDGQTNEPITGARIALGNLGARSHGDGTFEFLHVSDGHYTVSIDAPGFIAERRELELGPPEPEREEVFVLTPAGSVSGDVVDRLGAPVWNAEVAAGNPADWSHVARTDHAGHFVLAGLPPGDVQLSARHASAGALPLGGQTHVYPRQETPGAVLRLPDVGR